MSPRRTALATTLATVVLGSCGFAADPDLVASVDDAELTEDDFDALVREFTGDDEATSVDGETGRQIVGTFVGLEVIRADLEEMNVDPPVDDTSIDGVTKLQTDFQALVQTWSQLPPETLIDDRVIEFYEQGPDASGIVCAAHILVETEDAASDVARRLGEGDDFAALAAEVSIDPGSAAAGGGLGCFPIEQFEVQFIPEFVEAALDAEIGTPTDPVESEFGWHVIQLLPADQLGSQEAFTFRLATLDDRYDITIAPRFGQWDPNAIIVPVT